MVGIFIHLCPTAVLY